MLVAVSGASCAFGMAIIASMATALWSSAMQRRFAIHFWQKDYVPP